MSKKKTTSTLVPGDTSKNLFEYLSTDLKGSSLQLKQESDSLLVIEAEQLMEVEVSIAHSEKVVSYKIFSPQWKRHVTVEDLDGFDFLENKAEEDLKKMNLEANAEDLLLAIDLMRFWARANNYELKETRGS